MKLRKILCRVLGVSLGVLVLAALGGYCWLYSWSWGSAPSPHAVFTAAEAQQLQDFDTYLVKQLPGIQYEMLKQAREVYAADKEYEYDESGLTSVNGRPVWLQDIELMLSGAVVSKQLLGPARHQLHHLMESGAAAANACYLAALALQKHDVPLLRFLVEKGVDPQSSYMGNDAFLLTELILGADGRGTFLPVNERIALFEWLIARGVNIQTAPEEKVLLWCELSQRVTDDAGCALLGWFLRKGYKLDSARVAFILLQNDDSLPLYQQLIQEGLLPRPPREFTSEECSATPLQLVADAIEPAPETMRWLLAQGQLPDALPTGADTPAPEEEVEEIPRILRKTALDLCLDSIRFSSHGVSEQEDSRLRGKIECLDILLQHGARPTGQTQEMLPLNPELEAEIVEMFRRHGHHITAGEDPYNACCVPE